MTWWDYGALIDEHESRQDNSTVDPPTREEYYEARQRLIDRNDPSIRLQ